jgi:DNA-binding response OmpR family regulator
LELGRLRTPLEPDATRPALIRTERGAAYVFTGTVETVR